MGIKEMDIDAVAKAIEVAAGGSLPDLRQALTEAKAVMAGRITTPEQILVCGRHPKDRPDASDG